MATPEPPEPGAARPTPQAHLDRLRAVHDELGRLEELLCGGHRPISTAAHRAQLPAWLRSTPGESRWPVAIAILVAIGLQLVLPDQLILLNRWVLPALELTLLAVLVVAIPRRYDRESRVLRSVSLTLSGLITVANGWSAAMLVQGLISGRGADNAGPLLSAGLAIWVTNVIAFALWYWQFDRGGPAARAHARRIYPDFLFVQMQAPNFAPPDWEPGFFDYLYMSFTNAMAFSPTDTMPLSRWAKATMLLQELVSLVTVALVIAHAVNVLR